jgi:hypothetical protein
MDTFFEEDIASWSSSVTITGKDEFDLYEGIVEPTA